MTRIITAVLVVLLAGSAAVYGKHCIPLAIGTGYDIITGTGLSAELTFTGQYSFYLQAGYHAPINIPFHFDVYGLTGKAVFRWYLFGNGVDGLWAGAGVNYRHEDGYRVSPLVEGGYKFLLEHAYVEPYGGTAVFYKPGMVFNPIVGVNVGYFIGSRYSDEDSNQQNSADKKEEKPRKWLAAGLSFGMPDIVSGAVEFAPVGFLGVQVRGGTDFSRAYLAGFLKWYPFNRGVDGLWLAAGCLVYNRAADAGNNIFYVDPGIFRNFNAADFQYQPAAEAGYRLTLWSFYIEPHVGFYANKIGVYGNVDFGIVM